MSKGKKKNELRPWLTSQPDYKDKRFIQVGNSLMLDKYLQEALTDSEFRLYLCMAMESGGKPEFTFSEVTGRKYGFRHTNYHKSVRKLKALGMIEDNPRSNRSQYAASEYRFCERWKEESIRRKNEENKKFPVKK